MRATTRSSPLLLRVIDAGIEGTCMILIGVRTNDVAEEPQMPEHDQVEQIAGGLPGW